MRYKIWNKTDRIYTPSGHTFSAAEWLDRYAWAKIDGVKCVISDGPINGAFMGEFNAFVEQYKKMGCPIDDSMSDEEILQAIGDFEDNPPEPEPSIEERAVALEEFKAMATIEEYAPPASIIEKNFRRGLWSEKMVEAAAAKGVINEEDQIKIMSTATRIK